MPINAEQQTQLRQLITSISDQAIAVLEVINAAAEARQFTTLESRAVAATILAFGDAIAGMRSGIAAGFTEPPMDELHAHLRDKGVSYKTTVPVVADADLPDWDAVYEGPEDH
jgi:hypothetical protein